MKLFKLCLGRVARSRRPSTSAAGSSASSQSSDSAEEAVQGVEEVVPGIAKASVASTNSSLLTDHDDDEAGQIATEGQDEDLVTLVSPEGTCHVTSTMRCVAAYHLERRASVDPQLLQTLRQSSKPVWRALVTALNAGQPAHGLKTFADLGFLLLGSRPDPSWRSAVARGSVEACCMVVNTSEILPARTSALRVLCRLVRINHGAKRVVRGQHHQAFISLCRHPDPALARAALVCIYYLGADRDDMQVTLESCGLLPVLVSLCGDGQSPVLMEALQALKMMTRSAQCCATAEALGVRSVLLGLTDTESGSTAVACVAKAVLMRLDRAAGIVSPDTRPDSQLTSPTYTLESGLPTPRFSTTTTAAGTPTAAAPATTFAVASLDPEDPPLLPAARVSPEADTQSDQPQAGVVAARVRDLQSRFSHAALTDRLSARRTDSLLLPAGSLDAGRLLAAAISAPTALQEPTNTAQPAARALLTAPEPAVTHSAEQPVEATGQPLAEDAVQVPAVVPSEEHGEEGGEERVQTGTQAGAEGQVPSLGGWAGAAVSTRLSVPCSLQASPSNSSPASASPPEAPETDTVTHASSHTAQGVSEPTECCDAPGCQQPAHGPLRTDASTAVQTFFSCVSIPDDHDDGEVSQAQERARDSPGAVTIVRTTGGGAESPCTPGAPSRRSTASSALPAAAGPACSTAASESALPTAHSAPPLTAHLLGNHCQQELAKETHPLRLLRSSSGGDSSISSGDFSWLPLPPSARTSAAPSPAVASTPRPQGPSTGTGTGNSVMEDAAKQEGIQQPASGVPKLKLALPGVGMGPLTRRTASCALPGAGPLSSRGVPAPMLGARTARGGPALLMQPTSADTEREPTTYVPGSAWSAACRAGAPHMSDSMVLGSPVMTARGHGGLTARAQGGLTARAWDGRSPARGCGDNGGGIAEAISEGVSASADTTVCEAQSGAVSAAAAAQLALTSPDLFTLPADMEQPVASTKEGSGQQGTVEGACASESLSSSRGFQAVSVLKPYHSLPPPQLLRAESSQGAVSITSLTSSSSVVRRLLATSGSMAQNSHSAHLGQAPLCQAAVAAPVPDVLYRASTTDRHSNSPTGPACATHSSTPGNDDVLAPPGPAAAMAEDPSGTSNASPPAVQQPQQAVTLPQTGPGFMDAVWVRDSTSASPVVHWDVMAAHREPASPTAGCGESAAGSTQSHPRTVGQAASGQALSSRQLPAIAALASQRPQFLNLPAAAAGALSGAAGRYAGYAHKAAQARGPVNHSVSMGPAVGVHTHIHSAGSAKMVPAFMRSTAASRARLGTPTASTGMASSPASGLSPCSTSSLLASVSSQRSVGTGSRGLRGPSNSVRGSGGTPAGCEGTRTQHLPAPVVTPPAGLAARGSSGSTSAEHGTRSTRHAGRARAIVTPGGRHGRGGGKQPEPQQTRSAGDMRGGGNSANTGLAAAAAKPGSTVTYPHRRTADSMPAAPMQATPASADGGSALQESVSSCVAPVLSPSGGDLQLPCSCESPTALPAGDVAQLAPVGGVSGSRSSSSVSPQGSWGSGGASRVEHLVVVGLVPSRAPSAGGALQVRPPLPEPCSCSSPVRDSLEDVIQTATVRLGDFLLAPSDIELCRSADGRPLVLGEGGFGAVYRGLMHGVDEVAIKVAKKETLSRDEMTQFLSEVELLRRLHHRNIVQAYGVCLGPGAPCLVTELMRGGDMYHALRNHSGLMKWEVLGHKVALDIAVGLNHLHRQTPPLMHRDLKSPNVLLSEEGVAKIADVGMSRTQCRDLVSAQPIMTPLWAAPEVVAKQPASIKCDMWSLGVLVWELVTGCDITEYQPLAVSRQMDLTGSNTLTMPEDAPAVAKKIFEQCTQQEPSERPTAAQVVHWLREAAGTQ